MSELNQIHSSLERHFNEEGNRIVFWNDPGQKISLDLDDGVKVNYAKFGDLLAEAKAVCGTKEED